MAEKNSYKSGPQNSDFHQFASNFAVRNFKIELLWISSFEISFKKTHQPKMKSMVSLSLLKISEKLKTNFESSFPVDCFLRLRLPTGSLLCSVIAGPWFALDLGRTWLRCPCVWILRTLLGDCRKQPLASHQSSVQEIDHDCGLKRNAAKFCRSNPVQICSL